MTFLCTRVVNSFLILFFFPNESPHGGFWRNFPGPWHLQTKAEAADRALQCREQQHHPAFLSCCFSDWNRHGGSNGQNYRWARIQSLIWQTSKRTTTNRQGVVCLSEVFLRKLIQINNPSTSAKSSVFTMNMTVTQGCKIRLMNYKILRYPFVLKNKISYFI